MVREEVLREWKELKKRVLNNRFVVLTTSEINSLQAQRRTKQELLTKLDHKRDKTILSSSDQTKRHQLIEELSDLQRKLDFQSNITDLDWKTKLDLQTTLSDSEQKVKEYFQQAQALQEKQAQLTDKLNWVRTLVRSQDSTKLLELVREGRI